MDPTIFVSPDGEAFPNKQQVLIPPSGSPKQNRGPFGRTVICAIDGSVVSPAVLREALRLCVNESDRILILKVTEPKPVDDLNRHRAIVHTSFEDVRALIAEHAYLGRWNFQELNGDPRAVIIDATMKLGCDYLVIGSRGEGLGHGLGISVMPLGSVASFVVANSTCQTLIVKR